MYFYTPLELQIKMNRYVKFIYPNLDVYIVSFNPILEWETKSTNNLG